MKQSSSQAAPLSPRQRAAILANSASSGPALDLHSRETLRQARNPFSDTYLDSVSRYELVNEDAL